MDEQEPLRNETINPRVLHIDLEKAEWRDVDVTKRSAEGEAFSVIFGERILGQLRGLEVFTELYEESFEREDRSGKLPRCSSFLLGPSGVGKTESVRVFTELLLGDPEAMTRLDASEYVEDHRVAQLLGAPPGYIRSNEFPMLSQHALDLPAWQVKYGKAFHQAKQIFSQMQSRGESKAGRITRRLEELRGQRKSASGKRMSEIDHEIRSFQEELVTLEGELAQAARQLQEFRFQPGLVSYPSVFLIDEIEKAHDKLWNLVLQIMHGARLTVSFPQEYSDPETGQKILLTGEEHRRACRTNFTNCYLFFTSNLGREEIEALLRGKRVALGFASAVNERERAHEEMSQRVYEVAMNAFRKRARSEFRGRIDTVLVYQPLSEADMRRKLDALLRDATRELRKLGLFHLDIPSEAKEYILKEGTQHREEGVRLLEKEVRKRISRPLRRAFRSGELLRGDVVRVFLNAEGEKPKVDYQYDKKTRARYNAMRESGEEIVVPRVKVPEAGE